MDFLLVGHYKTELGGVQQAFANEHITRKT